MFNIRIWIKFLWLTRRQFIPKNFKSYANRDKYFVLRDLNKHGVLDYFKNPHSYLELLDDFDLKKDETDTYNKDLFNLLLKHKLLIPAGSIENKFILNTAGKDTVLQFLLENPDAGVGLPPFIIPPRISKDLDETLQEYGSHVFERMKGESVNFDEGFQLFNWDSALSYKKSMYWIGRECASSFSGLNNLKDGKLLDVGCGNGFSTADLWGKILPRNNTVHGIDASEDLINIAKTEYRKWAAQQDHVIPEDAPGIIFKTCRAEEIDYPDDHFDAVHIAYVLHWTEDPLVVVKECARVTKPGGYVFGLQGANLAVAEWSNVLIRCVGRSSGLPESYKVIEGFFNMAGLKYRRATMAGIFVARKPVK
ncbi:MAG: class I SAM-dependent methyltransferase [Candidatus Odinarchaeota archaeon]